eukprot:11647980-Alexandrium_andersonii.AAC.1
MSSSKTVKLLSSSMTVKLLSSSKTVKLPAAGQWTGGHMACAALRAVARRSPREQSPSGGAPDPSSHSRASSEQSFESRLPSTAPIAELPSADLPLLSSIRELRKAERESCSGE